MMQVASIGSDCCFVAQFASHTLFSFFPFPLFVVAVLSVLSASHLNTFGQAHWKSLGISQVRYCSHCLQSTASSTADKPFSAQLAFGFGADICLVSFLSVCCVVVCVCVLSELLRSIRCIYFSHAQPTDDSYKLWNSHTRCCTVSRESAGDKADSCSANANMGLTVSALLLCSLSLCSFIRAALRICSSW